MVAPVDGWSEGRFRAFLTSTLRSGFRRYPPKWEVLRNACVGKRESKKSKRQAMHYECALCHGQFTSTDMEVDHIDPVVSEEGWQGWETFIHRLYCPASNLQAICKVCHKAKTKDENTRRRTCNTTTKVVTKRQPIKKKATTTKRSVRLKS